MVGNEKAIGTDNEAITWSRFKEQFRKYHNPVGIMKTKQREFLALLQGSQSVGGIFAEIQSPVMLLSI